MGLKSSVWIIFFYCTWSRQSTTNLHKPHLHPWNLCIDYAVWRVSKSRRLVSFISWSSLSDVLTISLWSASSPPFLFFSLSLSLSLSFSADKIQCIFFCFLSFVFAFYNLILCVFSSNGFFFFYFCLCFFFLLVVFFIHGLRRDSGRGVVVSVWWWRSFYRLADDPLRSRSELPSVSSEWVAYGVTEINE